MTQEIRFNFLFFKIMGKIAGSNFHQCCILCTMFTNMLAIIIVLMSINIMSVFRVSRNQEDQELTLFHVRRVESDTFVLFKIQTKSVARVDK